MFSEDLSKLIEASLVDGVITEQERAVIRKRALLEGVDPDEVDLMLDAEVQKIRIKQEEAVAKVKKCPSCGEIIPALSGICPSCGYSLAVTQEDANHELLSMMSEMEAAIRDYSAGNKFKTADIFLLWLFWFIYGPVLVLRYINDKNKHRYKEMRRKALTLYGENKKLQIFINEMDNELKEVNNRKLMTVFGILLVVVLICVGYYFLVKTAFSHL